MKISNILERVRRKRVVRKGKVKWRKYSTREGYKVVDGKEVRISPRERRRRKLSQRKAAVKRRSKRARANRVRKRSMKKRKYIHNVREANETTRKVISHLKKHGEAKNEPDDKYDPKELEMGIEVEYEHSPNKQVAKEIAKDHLEELPDYYTRLKKMEKKGKEYWKDKEE